jgi:hypothetical protein
MKRQRETFAAAQKGAVLMKSLIDKYELKA